MIFSTLLLLLAFPPVFGSPTYEIDVEGQYYFYPKLSPEEGCEYRYDVSPSYEECEAECNAKGDGCWGFSMLNSWCECLITRDPSTVDGVDLRDSNGRKIVFYKKIASESESAETESAESGSEVCLTLLDTAANCDNNRFFGYEEADAEACQATAAAESACYNDGSIIIFQQVPAGTACWCATDSCESRTSNGDDSYSIYKADTCSDEQSDDYDVCVADCDNHGYDGTAHSGCLWACDFMKNEGQNAFQCEISCKSRTENGLYWRVERDACRESCPRIASSASESAAPSVVPSTSPSVDPTSSPTTSTSPTSKDYDVCVADCDNHGYDGSAHSGCLWACDFMKNEGQTAAQCEESCESRTENGLYWRAERDACQESCPRIASSASESCLDNDGVQCNGCLGRQGRCNSQNYAQCASNFHSGARWCGPNTTDSPVSKPTTESSTTPSMPTTTTSPGDCAVVFAVDEVCGSNLWLGNIKPDVYACAATAARTPGCWNGGAFVSFKVFEDGNPGCWCSTNSCIPRIGISNSVTYDFSNCASRSLLRRKL